jgi:predicted MFS family arabinose efflux permease
MSASSALVQSGPLGVPQPQMHERRNVLLLAGAQALFQTASVLTVTVAGIIGQSMASDKRYATLPVAMMMVGAALTMIPASMLMQRAGRRAGFMLGTLIGVAAAALAALAVRRYDFMLFAGACGLIGAYQGFAQFYRFAAAEASGAETRARAISWVIAGGIVAALAGPGIARYTQGIGPEPFFWSFVSLIVLGLVATALVAALRLPPAATDSSPEPARPLSQIMGQRAYLTALIGSAVGYGAMIMVMTATPIAMLQCGFTVSDAASVIQWHVLGMFAPSFFTGDIIRRVGAPLVMAAGALCLILHATLSLMGTGFSEFALGLVLVGVGWNFLFVGGTALLAQTYRASERAKAQGLHDFLVFGVLVAASFSAGSLLNTWGWTSVNLVLFPFLALALVLALALHASTKEARAHGAGGSDARANDDG